MLCQVEGQLLAMESSLVVSYLTKLCLRVVGVIRYYTAYILTSRELVSAIFNG